MGGRRGLVQGLFRVYLALVWGLFRPGLGLFLNVGLKLS